MAAAHEQGDGRVQLAVQRLHGHGHHQPQRLHHLPARVHAPLQPLLFGVLSPPSGGEWMTVLVLQQVLA